MIGDTVQRRLGGVVQVVGAILVVVMPGLLPVQGRMLEVGQCIACRTGTRQRYRLPQEGKQHEDEDGGAAHWTGSLPEVDGCEMHGEMR